MVSGRPFTVFRNEITPLWENGGARGTTDLSVRLNRGVEAWVNLVSKRLGITPNALLYDAAFCGAVSIRALQHGLRVGIQEGGRGGLGFTDYSAALTDPKPPKTGSTIRGVIPEGVSELMRSVRKADPRLGPADVVHGGIWALALGAQATGPWVVTHPHKVAETEQLEVGRIETLPIIPSSSYAGAPVLLYET